MLLGYIETYSSLRVLVNDIEWKQRIRSDKGLTLKTSALQSLYGGQITLSSRLIKLNIRALFTCQNFQSWSARLIISETEFTNLNSEAEHCWPVTTRHNGSRRYGFWLGRSLYK